MTLVDANVLLDIATDDPNWAGWSLRQLDTAAIRGRVLINAVVYAEFTIGYARIEEAEGVLAEVGIDLIERCFSPARLFSAIGPGAAAEREYCRTSSSVPTPPSRSCRS